MKTPQKQLNYKKSTKFNTKDTNFETNESSNRKQKQKLSVVSKKLKRANTHQSCCPLFQQQNRTNIFQNTKTETKIFKQFKQSQRYNPKYFTTKHQNPRFERYGNSRVYTIDKKDKSNTIWSNKDKQLFKRYISNVKNGKKIELSVFELSHLLLNLGFIRCMILSRQLVNQLYLQLKGCNILNLYLFLYCLYYHYQPQRDQQKQLANKISGWFYEYSFNFNQQYIQKEFLNLMKSISIKKYQSLLECYRSRPTCSSKSQINSNSIHNH